MDSTIIPNTRPARITLAALTTPAKILATGIIMTMAFGMLGALGQVIVHDIIPTFYSDAQTDDAEMHEAMAEKEPTASSEQRGDLFADLATVTEKTGKAPFYKNDQFVWTLRWTHIHLFGMNMIFIFLGIVTLLLDTSIAVRTWLIALPFIGVFIDILAMWLKAFVSPVFFWLHVPGGGVFAVIFAYVTLRALWEMWITPAPGS